MLPRTFRVAMFNRLRLAPFHHPAAIERTGAEWLVVERRGDFLLVSDTDRPVAEDEAAPACAAPGGLTPKHTLVGQLIVAQDAPETLIFLLVHFAPPGIDLPGTLFPAHGFARLEHDSGGLRLAVHGRHYHWCQQSGPGGLSLIDAGIPPTDGGGGTWHFSAEERDWAGASRPEARPSPDRRTPGP